MIQGMGIALEVVDRGLRVSPGEPVDLKTGDRLRVYIAFGYQGLQQIFTLYAAIGNRGFAGFDEIVHAEKSVECPAATEFTEVKGEVDIRITEAIDTGIYDLYAKIMEKADIADYVDNVIDVARKEEMGWKGVIMGTAMVLAGGAVLVALAKRKPKEKRK